MCGISILNESKSAPDVMPFLLLLVVVAAAVAAAPIYNAHKHVLPGTSTDHCTIVHHFLPALNLSIPRNGNNYKAIIKVQIPI